jgi:hypothetical protein
MYMCVQITLTDGYNVTRALMLLPTLYCHFYILTLFQELYLGPLYSRLLSNGIFYENNLGLCPLKYVSQECLKT